MHGDDVACGQLCAAADALRSALAGKLTTGVQHGIRWTSDETPAGQRISWFPINSEPATQQGAAAAWGRGGYVGVPVERTVYYGSYREGAT
jgi:hypothetical protein